VCRATAVGGLEYRLGVDPFGTQVPRLCLNTYVSDDRIGETASPAKAIRKLMVDDAARTTKTTA
jgi:hypothetical protein